MDGPKKRMRAFLDGPPVVGRLPGFFFEGLEWSEAELFLQAHVAPRYGLAKPFGYKAFVSCLPDAWRVSRQGAAFAVRAAWFGTVWHEKYFRRD